MLSIQPTHDRIFVTRKIPEETTSSGLLLINDTKEDDQGIVLAIGPGKTYSTGEVVPLTIQVGDKILFSQHAGQTTRIDDQDVLVMREDDVFAILES